MSTTEPSRRPPSLIVAAAGAGVLGLLVIGFAAASIASGHGTFSGAIAGWLAVYGLVGIASGVALWKRWIWGRGPLVTIAALDLIVAATMAPSAPLAWVVVAVSAVTLIAVALPATSRALRWTAVSESDEPRPTQPRES